MSKKAFSLLEILLSIAIITSIFSVLLIDKKDNSLHMAKNQLIDDLILTIYLASINDTNNPSEFWQLNFNDKINKQKVVAYSIFSDTNKNSSVQKKDKTITNPINNKKLATGGYYNLKKNKSSNELYLDKFYQIDKITLSKSCTKRNSKKLLFDNIGNLYISSYNHKAKGICEIILHKDNHQAKICLDSKSSFVYSC